MRFRKFPGSRAAWLGAVLLAGLALMPAPAPAQGPAAPPDAAVPLALRPIEGLGGAEAADPFGATTPQEEVVTVSAQFTAPEDDRPGRLFITAKIQENWHIYSITQAPGGPVRTQIAVEPSPDFKLLGEFTASPPPKPEKYPEAFGDLVVESHYGEVTWYAPIELAAGVDPAELSIQGKIKVQPCDPNTCFPPRDYPFEARLGPGVEVAGPQFDPEKLRENVTRQLGSGSLWGVLVGAFLGGILLNLMPCVLPVIGLKVLSFVEQSGRSRLRALTLNLWYSAGLISVFVLLAVLAVSLNLGWGHLFKYPAFNIAMAAVVFVMGLSFLGVWEIPIPGFVGRGKAADLAEQEGFSGAFAKGVVTTILATPCTGPFMGAALAWAVNQPPERTFAVFLSVGLGMASPYLLIGAFPALIRFLPKPGAWMETFKQVMGFVLLGTVVYIFTFLNWPYIVPTIGLLFALWAACWWIGTTSPTADGSTKARRWLEATAFAGAMWLLLFPGVDEIFSGRYAFRGLYDVMRGRFREAVAAGAVNDEKPEHELPWQPFTSREQFKGLVESGKTVLVDFTADWCATCKTLEAMHLNDPKTKKLVEQNRVVTLKADWSHDQPEVTAMLDLLGARQVPTLAIFPAGRPSEPIVFRGWYNQKDLLEALAKAGPSKGPS